MQFNNIPPEDRMETRAVRGEWDKPGSLHPACSVRTCILCKIIGHKWVQKIRRDNDPHPGYQYIHHNQMKGCLRCGEPNPNYEAQ